jgi:hypothetical protein
MIEVQRLSMFLTNVKVLVLLLLKKIKAILKIFIKYPVALGKEHMEK